MADIEASRRAAIARVCDGAGKTSVEQRRAAFAGRGLDGPLGALLDKVARRAQQIVDADVDAVRASGRSEDEIFELVVCAAMGEATRQYETARAALAAAVDKE